MNAIIYTAAKKFYFFKVMIYYQSTYIFIYFSCLERKYLLSQ